MHIGHLVSFGWRRSMLSQTVGVRTQLGKQRAGSFSSSWTVTDVASKIGVDYSQGQVRGRLLALIFKLTGTKKNAHLHAFAGCQPQTFPCCKASRNCFTFHVWIVCYILKPERCVTFEASSKVADRYVHTARQSRISIGSRKNEGIVLGK